MSPWVNAFCAFSKARISSPTLALGATTGVVGSGAGDGTTASAFAGAAALGAGVCEDTPGGGASSSSSSSKSTTGGGGGSGSHGNSAAGGADSTAAGFTCGAGGRALASIEGGGVSCHPARCATPTTP